jgi:hypothetical protein
MAHRSPTLEGFRVIFRRPSLTLAEIAWRWSFWGAVVFLTGVLLIEYLDSLPVGPRDLLFLDSGQPSLIGKALAHIFMGSGLRLALGATIIISAAGLAWTIIGAVGRSVSLRAIRDYVVEQLSSGEELHSTGSVRSLVGINLLRLVLALMTFVAVIGSVVLPARVFAAYHPKSGWLFLWTLLLLGMVSLIWATLNWSLSLAGVFVVRDGRDALGAMAAAARFSRERSGGLWAINFWFGLMHITMFAIGMTIASSVVSMAQILPGKVILTTLFLVALIYFVLADAIHVGRMAAWFCLAETPLMPPVVAEMATPFLPEPVAESPVLPMTLTTTESIEFPPEDDILSDIESRSGSHDTPNEQ